MLWYSGFLRYHNELVETNEQIPSLRVRLSRDELQFNRNLLLEFISSMQRDREKSKHTSELCARHVSTGIISHRYSDLNGDMIGLFSVRADLNADAHLSSCL